MLQHYFVKGKQQVLVAVNKVDGKSQHQHAAEFYNLGLPEEFFAVSASMARRLAVYSIGSLTIAA